MKFKVKVNEGYQYTDRSYETASWWTKYDVEPGEYEVYNGWKPARSYGFGFKAPATIVEDNFPSSFAGNPMSSPGYDRSKNSGKKVEMHHPFPDDYLQTPEWLIKWVGYHEGKLDVIETDDSGEVVRIYSLN